MVTGAITLYPLFGDKTYVEPTTKKTFRHLPCLSTEGFPIHITVSEDIFNKYMEAIMENDWEATNKFVVWGSVKSVNEVTQGQGLSNIYIRVESMIPTDYNENVNIFSLNGHSTDEFISDNSNNYYWIAANKSIINQDEQKKKPSYMYLMTDKDFTTQDKDILQGTVRIIEHNNMLMLKAVDVEVYSACRLLAEELLENN